MCTKFPASVMVLGIVSNKGHEMLPHFYPQGLRVNVAAYIEVLAPKVVKPWVNSVCNGRPMSFNKILPHHTRLK